MADRAQRPQRSALVGQVISLLREDISTGRWPVGTKIPNETDLAGLFGVSRITLRQAVQALVHVGQLETIQGSGTFVRATTEVGAVMSRYLDTEQLRPVLELRQALESYAAKMAASRARPTDLAAMRAAIDDSRRAVEAGDRPGTSRASVDFHRSVVEASGNPPLIAIYTALLQSVLDSISRSGGDNAPSSFVDGHAQILDAIERGDARAAHDLAEQHLDPTLPPTDS